MQKLPVGIQTFSEIREEGYVCREYGKEQVQWTMNGEFFLKAFF